MEGADEDLETSPDRFGGDWGTDPAMLDLGSQNTMHVMNATTAAFHAEVAAKHAASLAQYVQYLAGTLGQLNSQVSELEEWKRGALDDVRKLKEEHNILKMAAVKQHQSKNSDGEAKSSPASLELTAPPPLPGPSISTDSFTMSPSAVPSSLSSRSFGDIVPKEDSVQVTQSTVDGKECERAEWRVSNLSVKLRGCMGRALVSPPFSALGMEDLRLMMYADAKEAGQGVRNRRQKEQYAKKITEGPLEGRLSLKIPNCPDECTLQLHYGMGSHQRGPFTHNFAESIVSECDDFGVDWLKELDADLSLTLRVDIMRAPSTSA